MGGNTHIYTTGSTPTDITSGLTGGQLGGIVQARDTNIPAVQGQLDTLAYGIASSVNTANANGVDANGNPGGNIFNIPGSASGSAAGISVAISNPSLIASAVSGEGPGGNTNATALANLATANTVSGTTPSGFYASFLSSVGDSVSSATAQNTSQQSVLTQLTTQRDALSGVTLDDEASNLTEFERSYQAASQVFSIIDTLVASALNLGESAVVT